AAGGPAGDGALLRSAARHITDIAMRFRTLFRRLGDGLDGPGSYSDADAWYCILEGTADVAAAEAQARARVDLLAHYAAHGQGSPAPPHAGRAAAGRSCWRSRSSARCGAGCRSGSCMSGPAPSGWR